ncbi:beta-N-acetylhexosaminidase [Allostreptomyces psammosilenae]|uniref:Hexosaminidase n=1 Tax=Allostreptomyces psammosilenae TaxID=1892865 RepID=A0A853A548_9ACTN|nr:glycoside hydrolase family 20 protein [Allostreptomyces psammosilenae]NYI07994.1 hexosaminidase [Allostreptomyces psammosilenae]
MRRRTAAPAASRRPRTSSSPAHPTGPVRAARPWTALLGAALAAGLLAGCSDAGGPAAAPSPSGSTSESPSPVPTVPRPGFEALPGPLAVPPAVPAVREFEPAGGEGWWIQPRTRVVVDSRRAAELSDEAELFAAELAALAGDGREVEVLRGTPDDVRTGDVLLTIGQVPAPTAPADGPGTAPAPSAAPEGADGADGADAADAAAPRATADTGLPTTADEAYLLRVDTTAPAPTGTGAEIARADAGAGRLVVAGATDTGVLRGTRTVLQSLQAVRHLPSGTVVDRPDRPQRGLSIDLARKFFDKEWIADRIREAAWLKLNQVHLHLSDDQGFRLASDSHPEVVSEQHLSKEDVRELVALAERYHVTLVPEIDSPGHLGQVVRAHPDLALVDYAGDPSETALDIADPAARELLLDLVLETAELFPGPWFHIGGDEYIALMARDPEATYPALADYARRTHGPDATIEDAATGWLNTVAAALHERGKTVKAWNDGRHHGGVVEPDPRIEVEYWTGKEYGATEPEVYLDAGDTLVNLNDEYLYYVLGEPNDFAYPTGQRILEEWQPSVLRGSTPSAAELTGPDRVTGGRLALWCDLADAQTADQVAAGLRMPLRAVAEKLWVPGPARVDWKTFDVLTDRVGDPVEVL